MYVNAYFEKDNVMQFVDQYHYQYEQHLLVALLNISAVKMSRKDKAAALAKIKDYKE